MSALGIHLKSNGFSAVEIETKKKEKILMGWGFRDIENFTLDLSNPESISSYTTALKEFLFDHNFKSKDVVASLPQEQVFVRTIKVPQMDKKDLGNFVKYESEQYIPIPLKEVILGYDVLREGLEEDGKLRVLLVAARKDIVHKYISIIKSANLTPLALEPESLAMTRALGGDSSTTFAEVIVEMGFKETLIVLAYKGFVILTRTVPLGETSMIKELSQKLDLDLTQAGEYYRTYGLDKTKVSGKVYEVLAPLFAKVVSEIKKSKIFFTTRNSNVRINKILVSGQTAFMPGLLLYMVNSFNVEVELANPWVDLNLKSFSAQQDEIQKKGPIFAIPVGLALKTA